MIEFREITRENFDECLFLDVTEEQGDFVASTTFSLAEAKIFTENIPLAIYDQDTMVGFIMYGLDPDDKRTFHKFSLGMKQRLGIAAAIMENPDIIILDEPINALDDTGTEQIRDILIRHRERGALIIIACHDADELNFLSDEIIEIVQGQIKPSKDDKKSA